ncbi:hypothetical protein SAMN04488074_105110 [Lentzea albidocapillata subsp. violacea]|uniref:Uncharacterized protein n=1 Tax=Lentzea albidocapillata subsp. violacea TaxID=128104 RepID=A0A1G9AUW9_9PSEU|nr:hypothetical protein [Lentzea albidocapillata]SDK30385.1 hypothetical protein SAMN04488074_105110 [Lentzea albidocapillata subsp. violacea]
MALVRILQAVAGADFSWVAGDVVAMTDEQVAVWCDGDRAELARDVVVDQAATDQAVEDAVRQALVDAEQQRQAELEGLQVQARAVVDDNVVDPDGELAGQLRELAAELVAGVAPVRAAELAIAATLGEKATNAVVEGAPSETAAAAMPEEETTVPATEQNADGAVPAPQEERTATGRPERAAKRSRAGGGRAEPTPETRG